MTYHKSLSQTERTNTTDAVQGQGFGLLELQTNTKVDIVIEFPGNVSRVFDFEVPG